MKKNYFRLLLAIAMMLMTGVSFTSCDDVLDVVDNPAAPSTEPEGKTEEADIEQTAQGAKVTINNLSAIAAFSDEIKEEIVEFQKKNPDAQFVLDIEPTAALETTDANNTLLIPELSNFDIVINVNGNLTTNGNPLILKLDQKAGTRKEEPKPFFTNTITLNLKNDDVDLILDVPGTTVNINKLNSIQILNGVSVIKDDGSIKTYIWAPSRNDYYMNNGEPEWVQYDDSEENYIPNVRYADGTPYYFKNLKIVKGKADYANVNVWVEKYKLDKLTIADGATVMLNSNSYINEIEGEGSAKLILSGSWGTNTEDNVTTYYTQGELYNTSKISNVAIENYFDEGTEYDKSFSSIYGFPVDAENVTFKIDEVNFAAPNSTAAAVKNCKFVGTSTNQKVNINIPGQTEAINAFKFNFEKCEFNENVSFNTYINTSKPKVDKDGNTVYEDLYNWVVYDNVNNYWSSHSSPNMEDIPEDLKAAGELENNDWIYNESTEQYEPQKGYWKTKRTVWEEITFKDFYATVAFTECKYAGETMTAKQYRSQSAWMPQGAHLRFEFDGKTYRALWDTENQTYILIEA